MTDGTILSASSIRKDYGRRRSVAAVADVSLQVLPDEMVTLVGPSGCGKTTLLRVCAGLIEPTSGRVVLEGISPTEYRKQYGVGYVSQSAALLPWRTAFNNVALPFEVGSREVGDDYSRAIHDMMSMLGIDEYADLYPSELSGGIGQRVAVARALLFKATIVFLDEPFSSLDSISRERLWLDASAVFRRRNTAALMVSHNISEAVAMSDRVLVLSARPARIVGEVKIGVERPRRLDFPQSSHARDCEQQVRALLFSKSRKP